MTDPILVVAEARGGELLCALQSAVNGDPGWRKTARLLLDDISHLRLPEPAHERLREIDSLRRAAEILEDVTNA